MVKRASRENARDRKCSEDMTDSDLKSPKKKGRYNLRNKPKNKKAETIWVDDDTLDSDDETYVTESDSESTAPVNITLVIGKDDPDEEYATSDEEEVDAIFLKYLEKKYVKEADKSKARTFPEKKPASPPKKDLKIPISLTRDELSYFKKQPITKQQELVDLMTSMSALSMNDGDVPTKFKVLQLPISDYMKSNVIKKMNALIDMGNDSGESYKLRTWIDAFLRIPFGKTVPLPVKIEDGRPKCTEFMSAARKTMDDEIYGMIPAKTQIMQVVAQWIVNPDAVGNVIALQGPMGVGKCHAKDTPILMYDGSIKLVQDIEVDDLIMGDDSTPRKVLSLGRGKDIMYDIIPTKGEKYTVNKEHILCLKQSGKGCIKPITRTDNTVGFKTIRFDSKEHMLKYKTFDKYEDAESYLDRFTDEDNISEISVKDYIKLPNEIKKNWLKGYKAGVDFETKPLDFDPYILGLWLGDGSSSTTMLTSQDAAILGYLNSNLPKYDLMLNYYAQYDYRIRGCKKGENVMLKVLQNHNLINNKHIPELYKINDRDTRLKVLAGLVDSDGYTNNNTIEISQKSKKITDDIVFIARSLGFACYVSLREKSCMYKDERKSGLYHIITISGNLTEIPILVKRKKPTERLQKKNCLVTSIQVECIGEGDYYGFTLDGNHRYLMGDFTVTHNTSFARNAIAKVLKRPFEFFSLGGSSDISNFVGHSYTYEGSMWGRIADCLMHAGTMNPVMYFDELDKVSTTPQGEEIMNMMIHLTDRSQNTQFHDRYFSGVDFDVSQCLFVFSFNDIDKVHPILRDRMTIIHCDGYKESDKKIILKNHIWPQVIERLRFKEDEIILQDDAIEHIITEFSGEEKGVRNLIRTIEGMMTRLNMLRVSSDESMKEYGFYIELSNPIVITPDVVKILLFDRDKKESDSWKSMYV
jgi:hypothetical protein